MDIPQDDKREPDSEHRLGRVQSLVRAFGMLDQLAKHDDGLNLTQVAALVNLPRSTAHRLLITMQELRYVEFDPATHRWHIGSQAFSVGSAFAQTRDLARLGRPIMRSLMIESHETVNISMMDADSVHYVGQVETVSQSPSLIRPGLHLDLHTTAAGKAMLAHWADRDLDRFLSTRELAPRTAASITARDKLVQQLQFSRQQGYAVDDQETALGMRCVAAPVFDVSGIVRASLSISAPIYRMPHDRLPELGANLVRAAQRLTGHIGGTVSPAP